MRKHPEHIQSYMVTKCIENNWESIHNEPGTILQEEAPKNYPQPPEIIQEEIEKATQTVRQDERVDQLEKLYGSSKEDIEKARKSANQRIKELLK